MIKISHKGNFLKVLTDEEIKKVHTASLEILDKIGIGTDSPRIFQVLSDGKADVDEKNMRVKFHPALIENAINKSLNAFKIYGRNPENDILLEKGRVHFGLGGAPTSFFKETASGEIRSPTKEDVATTTRMGDSLSNVSFIQVLTGSYDVPLEVQYLHDLDALLNNTQKPIICLAPGLKNAQKAIEMACKIVGENQLKKRPPITLFTDIVSPLYFSKLCENVFPLRYA